MVDGWLMMSDDGLGCLMMLNQAQSFSKTCLVTVSDHSFAAEHVPDHVCFNRPVRRKIPDGQLGGRLLGFQTVNGYMAATAIPK